MEWGMMRLSLIGGMDIGLKRSKGLGFGPRSETWTKGGLPY